MPPAWQGARRRCGPVAMQCAPVIRPFSAPAAMRASPAGYRAGRVSHRHDTGGPSSGALTGTPPRLIPIFGSQSDSDALRPRPGYDRQTRNRGCPLPASGHRRDDSVTVVTSPGCRPGGRAHGPGGAWGSKVTAGKVSRSESSLEWDSDGVNGPLWPRLAEAPESYSGPCSSLDLANGSTATRTRNGDRAPHSDKQTAG